MICGVFFLYCFILLVSALYLLCFQGVYGYPIEIQALFFMALRCALVLLKQDVEGKEFVERIVKRLHALNYHMRSYFWLDLKQLNDIYRYKTEEYSHTAVNKFNVIPDSLPEWVFDFMPLKGGYFIGNVSPARMDFRWFGLGNCIAILSSLATEEQSNAIMDLIESRWEELVGEMPLKVCYPAIESHEWRIVTGCDPKNTRWSYHNGGSWPGIFCTFVLYILFHKFICAKKYYISCKTGLEGGTEKETCLCLNQLSLLFISPAYLLIIFIFSSIFLELL